MLSAIARWLPLKWRLYRERDILQSYPLTFNTMHGQIVLQHLLDNVYCTIYEGNDPIALAQHNGQRSVVHSILENIDYATNPVKREIMQGAENGAAS